LKNKRVLYIIITSIVFLALLVFFIIQDIRSTVVRSNIDDFQSFTVLSEENGGRVVFVPYGVELEGDTEGLDLLVVDTGNPTIIIDVNNRNEIGTGDVDSAIMNVINGSKTNYMGIYSGPIEIEGLNKPIMIGDKISYEIRLPIESELLDMPPEREWILLSMENDKTLMRTWLGFEISKAIGMKYTPNARYVELFINGDYKGTYLLAEKVEISSNRLDIEKITPDIISGEGISGGYLMQIDLSRKMKPELEEPNGKNLYFTSNYAHILPGAGESSRIVVKQSKKLFKVHLDYIRDYVREAETVLFSDSFKHPTRGFRAYFDERSFIDWYIIQELFKNPDVPFLTGPYFYKERWSNIKMGPVWDFDFSAGASEYKDAIKTEGWYVRNTAWYDRMFQDENFDKAFKNRWKTYRDNIFICLESMIDAKAEELKASVKFNNTKWSVTTDGYLVLRSGDEIFDEYYQEVNQLKEWLRQRIEWIDSNIQ